MVILNFLRVPRWFCIGRGENLQHCFLLCPKEHAIHIKHLYKVYAWLHLSARGRLSVCIIFFTWRVVAFIVARLMVIRKNDNGKKTAQLQHNQFPQLLTKIVCSFLHVKLRNVCFYPIIALILLFHWEFNWQSLYFPGWKTIFKCPCLHKYWDLWKINATSEFSF